MGNFFLEGHKSVQGKSKTFLGLIVFGLCSPNSISQPSLC